MSVSAVRVGDCGLPQGRQLKPGWRIPPLPLLSGNRRAFFKKRYVGQQDGWQVKVFVTKTGDLSSDLRSA